MKRKQSRIIEKRDFLVFGFLNVLITNICLQIFLLLFPVATATLFSQSINLCLGFTLYSKKVFKVKYYTKHTIIKYLILSFILWSLNWYGIENLNKIVSSKNIAALIVLPIVAFISYLSQRKLIFDK